MHLRKKGGYIKQPFQKQVSGQGVFIENIPYLCLKNTQEAGIVKLGVYSEGFLDLWKSTRGQFLIIQKQVILVDCPSPQLVPTHSPSPKYFTAQ